MVVLYIYFKNRNLESCLKHIRYRPILHSQFSLHFTSSYSLTTRYSLFKNRVLDQCLAVFRRSVRNSEQYIKGKIIMKRLTFYPYEMAKDEQIIKYWPPSEWKEWRKNLIYLTRHLPPKQGVALGA